MNDLIYDLYMKTYDYLRPEKKRGGTRERRTQETESVHCHLSDTPYVRKDRYLRNHRATGCSVSRHVSSFVYYLSTRHFLYVGDLRLHFLRNLRRFSVSKFIVLYLNYNFYIYRLYYESFTLKVRFISHRRINDSVGLVMSQPIE